ncbi:MAG: hypothetical protein M3134_09950 [Actinomycetota bacterium]|nr:hypothetical protein [Actinomycetota bacterium]
MKRLAVAVFFALATAAPAASAAPPPHGCDQAAQTGVGGNYHSTCDGSPSQNGNGGGKGTGKPCAGCVGAADNKNPPGQYPDGSDSNNGYECDGNSGIGKTNPAHTGCMSEPYSGASVDTSSKGRGHGSKNQQKTSFRIEARDSGTTGAALLVVLGLGVAGMLVASRVARRVARR